MHPASEPKSDVMVDTSSVQNRGDRFIVELTKCQNRLYAYILSLLPDRERAHDVLQETNLVMWRKADQFEDGTSFHAWACKIAYFEVLAERRRRCKDRHVFTESLLELVSNDAVSRLSDFDGRAVALEECLEHLEPQERERLLERYRSGGSVSSLAEKAGVTPGAAAVALYRIRKLLLQCVQRKLGKVGAVWS